MQESSMNSNQCDDTICIERLSDTHITAYMNAFTEVVRVPLRVSSIESEKIYLQERMAQKTPFFFVVILKKTKQLIGAIEIRDVSHRSQLYCWLNEKWWGSGAFQKAMKLVSNHYFSKTKEVAISARVDYSNERSKRALEKAGFVVEGIASGPREKQYCMRLKK